MENVTRNEREQFAEAAEEIRRRDANRKACPVAATLFDTLIEAQAQSKGDQGVVASFIIQLGGRIEDREEVSAEDAEKCLRSCGLWPELPPGSDIRKAVLAAPKPLVVKAVFAGREFYLVELGASGEAHWISAPVDAIVQSTHLVLVNGTEVARIPADNDHHARNKALKLFGPDARAVQVPREPEPVADPFSRIR
jgi:hypothetical protein